ncbi:hypothetical protein BGZ58_005465 [Dissophora ornata]|nr:hypothetical protein BGZ58_005465 [Dissophora ornata]
MPVASKHAMVVCFPSSHFTKSTIQLYCYVLVQVPAQPVLAEKPFRDSKSRSSSPSPSETVDECISGVLIDYIDTPAPKKAIRHSIGFQVDEKVRDPFQMYYADPRQKVDLPTMFAQARDCVAKVSEDGRSINVSGENKDNVNKCIVQIQQMQEYFLRTPFRMEKVSLVYGSRREEFRLQFVPVAEHEYYSKRIQYLPTSLTRAGRDSFCVAGKAVYDVDRDVWALRKGVWQPAQSTALPPNLPGSNVVPSTSQKGKGPAQGAWGRGSTSAGRSPSSGSRSDVAEWHEQEYPAFGFAPPKGRATPDKSQSMSPSGWGPPSSHLASAQSQVHSAWSSSAGSSSTGSPKPTARGAQVVVRKMANPEWAAPTFEGGESGDFPSLSMGPKSSPKKSGMPTLPPPRKAEPLDPREYTTVGSSGSGESVPKSSTPQGKPKTNQRPDMSRQSVTATTSNDGLIFGEEELDFLANIPVQSSSSRPKERDSSELELARLADPAKVHEDSRRVIRTMPLLQASPVRSTSSQIPFTIGMRDYNMRRLSQAIRNGLSELRGQRKEIRLIGRLGCVLYPKGPSILNQIWEYTQLEKVVVKERGVQPIFCPIVTIKNEDVNNLYGFLGPFATESAHFEIECNTRINPTSRYVRTLVTVPSKAAILDRVVTPWDTYGEVIWNAVDKHMDFEILLQAREGVIHDTKSALGRTDVKPFSTFRKKLSIGTHNSHITCYDINGYLEVLSINFKETRTYVKPEGFTVVIHKIEELKLQRTAGLDAVTARTFGNGRKWYEIEVHNENINRNLLSNLTLIPGTVADWEVDGLVGPDPSKSEELERIVKTLMLIVDECQEKF